MTPLSKFIPGAITSAMLLFSPLLALGDTISTWNGGTGNWSSKSDWTPAAVPGYGANANADVTINTGADDITMEFFPAIGSLTLGGSAGSSILEGGAPAAPFTVSKNMTVGVSGILGGLASPGAISSPFSSPITVSGNVTNAGNIYSQGNLLIGGNLTNTGSMGLPSPSNSGSNLFNVGGTLLNQGNLTLGSVGNQVFTGPTTTIGKLVNQGSLTIGAGTLVTLTAQPGGITEIPSGSSWYVGGTINAGSQNAFAHLTSIQGSLTLYGISTPITPIGGTLSGSLVLDGGSIIVNGNYVGGGVIGASNEANLDVTGTFTSGGLTVLDGGISASKFVNYSPASFVSGGPRRWAN